MGIERALFNRTQLLLGDECMEKLANARVIIFGVGGVGSWCAEALVRSGISRLTIVDSDCVCITNINRQLMADTTTIGMVKVEALRQRLLAINPTAKIETRQEIYCAENNDEFHLEDYDYIIDAIDSLKDKVSLILNATRTKAKFFSSMGAALKIDPSRVQVAEFWNVKGCPLARALRQRFKKLKRYPAKKFKCVFSDELLENRGSETSCGSEKCLCPKNNNEKNDPLANHEWCSSKAQINGSLMHITALFGMTLAGLVIQDINQKN